MHIYIVELKFNPIFLAGFNVTVEMSFEIEVRMKS